MTKISDIITCFVCGRVLRQINGTLDLEDKWNLHWMNCTNARR